MSKALALLAVALLIAGCASAPRWYLNGRTLDAFNMHAAQCQAMAAQSISQQNAQQAGYMAGSGQAGYGLAMALMESAAYDLRVEQCMAANGYTRAP